MRFPEKTLNDLEWSRLCDHWADRCTGEAAAKRCRRAAFFDAKKARAHLALVGELLAALVEGDAPPSLAANPLGDTLSRIEHQGGVSGEALIWVAQNLKLFAAIARYLDNRRDAMPGNAALVVPAEGSAAIVKLANLAGEIESSFEPDGSVSDRASAELSTLRARVVSLRKHLTARIEKIAEREDDLLQECSIAVRNERFVLPVRADAHRRLSGIVHGASGSGATVFVEPEEVIEVGNDLMLAREAVLREEARVIADLAEAVRDELPAVRSADEIVIDVETRIAAARLSLDLGAAVPQEGEAGEVQLVGARHPLLLLAGVDVVPCAVRFTRGRCLVISGPNAGGKTVVLKTVGLLGLMRAAGLPVPAAPDSIFGAPLAILTDIGDDQSLKENLSTFSAHMTNIARILNQAGPGTIVLLDELSAGTDPGEGAALAEAILDHLCKEGASTLATTHFDTLKTRALGDAAFENASVGFDMRTMRPTFELFQGTPGTSSALAVAERFGAPRSVVAHARSVMSGGSRRLESAIRSLEDERRRLVKERSDLADALRHAEDLERKRQKELARLKQREEKFIDEERESLWREIRMAREKVRDAEQTVKRQRRDADAVNRSRRQINAVAEALSPGGDLAAEPSGDLPGRPAKASDIAEGAAVFVSTFNKKGVVAGPLRGKSLFVTVGSLKTKVGLADLRVMDAPAKAPPPQKLGAPALARREDPIQTRENTLDLRGMTSEEAVDAADAFLDRAMKDDFGVAFIIHGHGTGALKSAIRGYVIESAYVADSRPGRRGEGGDGVTVVWVR